MPRHTAIDWPDSIDRTPATDREHAVKFSATLGETTADLAEELDRMDVDEYRASIGNTHTKSNTLPRHNAAPDDPGFVLRWRTDGRDHAVACDAYTDLRDNVRAVYLWIHETRMREARPVATAADSFAAAALPAGNEDEPATAAPAPPHDVLEVSPDASPAVVKAAARSKKAAAHPDSDDTTGLTIKEVERAEAAMLDD